MVAVVVHHHHAVPLALDFEAPAHAAEPGQGPGDGGQRDAGLQGHADGPQGVLHVVAPRMGQLQFAERGPVQEDLEHALGAAGDDPAVQPGLVGKAVGQGGPVHPGQDAGHARIVQADHGRAVERQAV